MIGTFVTSFVAVGHGVAPIGFFLLMGWGFWTPILIVAWTAIGVLIAGCLIPGQKSWVFLLAGSILSSLVWVWFLLQSDSVLSTIIFSSHFLIVTAFLFRHLFVHRTK